MLLLAQLSLMLALAGQAPTPTTAPAPIAAPSTNQCASAKAAVGNWLMNSQAGKRREELAARCAEVPGGWNAKQVHQALDKIKRAVDANAVHINVALMPDKLEYIDPKTGVARVMLAPSFDERLYVHRVGDRWLIAIESLLSAEGLARRSTIDLTALRARLPAWMKTPLPIVNLAGWQVVFFILFFLLGFTARLIVSGLLTKQLEKLMARLKVQWGEQLLKNASTPLGNLGLAGVLALGQPSLELGLMPAQVMAIAIRVLAAFSLIHLFYRSIDLLGAYLRSKAAKTETKLDDQLVPILMRALRTATVAIGVVFVLQNLDIDVTSLITGVGLGGLAFALAAQDAVKNLFGSFTIFLDKPFQIGDWVVASGVEGMVEEVGIRSTRIRTFYNSIVTVPNASFTDAVVDNYGRRQYRRTSTTLSLTYDTPAEKIEAFCDGLRGILQAHPLVRKDYFEVHFVGFADSALEIMFYFFFECDSWSAELRARHEVYLEVLRFAEELGVSFAYPTQTLHVESLAKSQERVPPKHAGVGELKTTVEDFGPGGKLHTGPGQRVHDGFYPG